MPIGASSAVAVVTVTLSASAHSDDSASPRNPKVDTVSRSENDASLDVWCFRAIYLLPAKNSEEDIHDSPMAS